MSGRSLEDWLAYISAQHPATIALGLDRVHAVAKRMGLEYFAPAAGAQSVTIIVGGTNGKGSTCAFLESILSEAGYKTGLYTSPHLLRYNERVRVGGEEACDAVLADSFARVEAARGDTQLTYFEFGTLAAIAVFADAKVDAAILEVGLGGRLDAVNIVDADCAIVASVDLDHQAFLGTDRESIGFEKAGIFRSNRPAIFGDTGPPSSLVAHAEAVGADLQIFGRDFRYEAAERQWDFFGRKGARRALPIPALRGRWQLKNASTALAALAEVDDRLPVSLGEVKHGLMHVRLPGRLQVLPGRPSIVLDVGHNPHAARSLADGLGDMGFFENTFAVFAILADKDVGGVIDAMRGRIDRWYVSAAQAERAAPAAMVSEALAQRGLGEVTRRFASVAGALDAARRDAGPNDRIIVFGSFYTVAEALRSAR
ncbi:MAG: bifunctional tetrahydrofolate synthase/dihydrofolate synthase [Usitatibacter sp.]